jgi:FtsZ-binding cell division protein ZapB
MTEIKRDTPTGGAGNAAPVKPSRKVPVGLIAIAVVLAAVLVYVIVAYQKQKTSMYEMERMLTSEKDSLANELRLMIHGYDTLRTNNDTLNAQLVREQDRIKKLLAINASNVQLIKTYRAEIGTMRNIMKSYIVQIDSLNTRNKILVAENQEIRGQIDSVTQTNVELEKVKVDLSAKVEIASVIQAKDITAVGLNTKQKEVDRVDRLDKLRVCFTLRENPIAAAGRKTVYLRVLRPDGLLITDSPDNVFTYGEENLIFSAKRDVDYENLDIEMCIFVDNTGDFVAGSSVAEVYLDGNLIGTSTFVLRGR